MDEQSDRALCFAGIGDLRSARSALDAVAADANNPQVACARAVVARLEGRLEAANRHLADAVRYGYPAALLKIDPAFQRFTLRFCLFFADGSAKEIMHDT